VSHVLGKCERTDDGCDRYFRARHQHHGERAVKKLVFAVGSFMAVATSTAWAQDDAFSNAPYSHEPGYYYYGSSYAPQPASPAYYGVDPTAHYWDYYRLDPVDRTTPP
jgi:hypothetical protein